MLAVEVPHDLIASSSSNVQSPKEEPSHDQGSTAHSDVVVLEESTLPKSTPINRDSPKDSISVRLDISFKSPSHTGLQTTELVCNFVDICIQKDLQILSLGCLCVHLFADREANDSLSYF